jgi:hypothetical protein
MTRAQYAGYLLRRVAEALAVAGAAAAFAGLLQRHGAIHAPAWALPRLSGPPHGWVGKLLGRAAEFAWPVSCAALAHLLLGPKQTRPVYLRIPGAMYAFAGVTVSRNAGCRGGLVTGATGSGKTLSCILPRLHSLCVNECGAEREGWRGSPMAVELAGAKRNYRAQARAALEEEGRLVAERAARFSGEPGADALDRRIELLRFQAELRAEALQRTSDGFRRARYRVPPWGGFVCGEKGTEWQMVDTLLRHHAREEDLCLLRTRPARAPADWRPAVRLNLLSLGGVPADTYAKMIVDTGLSVEEARTRDEFFVPQARDKIAWGIRLARAVERQAAGAGRSPPIPTLPAILDILTAPESYRQFLVGATEQFPGLAADEAFGEARFQLENNYWNQPPEQLGGVRSTLHNFLAPYAEPEIAEVFCASSTFDLRDIQLGKVVCLAIPQRYAVQRRYVTTLLKTLAYQVVLERFDRRQDHPDWSNRNVVLVEQDEWQRHAVRADCEVDIVREAQGAAYAATQSQNAVWLRLGGRDEAAPLIANLRNRWICQAATEECAEESSRVVSSRVVREVSFSEGDSGRTTNVSFPEKPIVPGHELRTLPPFHVVFAPAEGRWLFRTCIAMPPTADGRIPPWWFGDWNPLHWAAVTLGLPERAAGVRIHPGAAYVPPWRAAAPLRAVLRWLAGLDGTFIITGGMRARAGGAKMRP